MCKQPMSKVKERVWERGNRRETNPSERQRKEWRRMRRGGEDKSTGVEKAKYGMVRKFEKLDKCKKEKV